MNWWESDPVSGGTAAVATPPQNNWWENDPPTTAVAPQPTQLTTADILYSTEKVDEPTYIKSVPQQAAPQPTEQAISPEEIDSYFMGGQTPGPTFSENAATYDLEGRPDPTYGGRYGVTRPTQDFIERYNKFQRWNITGEPYKETPYEGKTVEQMTLDERQRWEEDMADQSMLGGKHGYTASDWNAKRQEIADRYNSLRQYQSEFARENSATIPQQVLDATRQQVAQMPDGPEKQHLLQSLISGQQLSAQSRSDAMQAAQLGMLPTEFAVRQNTGLDFERGALTSNWLWRTPESIGMSVGTGLANVALSIDAELGKPGSADRAQRIRSSLRQYQQLFAQKQAEMDKNSAVPMAGLLRQAGEVIGTSALAGQLGGMPTLIGYYATTTAADSLGQSDELGVTGWRKYSVAAGKGMLEGLMTAIGGKLGAGTARLAGASGSTLEQATEQLVAQAARKYNLSKPLARIANILAQGASGAGGENFEELTTTAGQYILDRMAYGDKYNGPSLYDQLLQTSAVSTISGGFGGAVSGMGGKNPALKRAVKDLSNKVDARIDAMQGNWAKRIVNSVKNSVGNLAQDIRDANRVAPGYEEEAVSADDQNRLAAKVAAGQPISRKDLENVGVSTKGTNVEQRKELAKQYVEQTQAEQEQLQEPTNAVTQGQEQGDNQQEYQQAPGGGLRTEKVDSHSFKQGGQVQEEVAQEVINREGLQSIAVDKSIKYSELADRAESDGVSSLSDHELQQLFLRAPTKGGKHLRKAALNEIRLRGLAEPRRGIAQDKKGYTTEPERGFLAPDDPKIDDNTQYAHDSLIRSGATLDDTSESGSRYYTLKDGTKVRVSDHSPNAATQNWIDNNGVEDIRTDSARAKSNIDSLLSNQSNEVAPEVTPLAGRVPQGDLVRETADTLSAAPTLEGKVSNEIPEQAQDNAQEVQAQAEAQNANGQEGLLAQPPGQPTPVASPLTTDQSAAPAEAALPDWVTEDEPILPPAEADRPKATPKETAKVRRTIKGMLGRGVINEQEAEILRGMHPHDVQAMLNQARELSDGDYQYKQELRNELNALFGTTGAKEQEVQQIITKDGKKRTRKVSAVGRKSAQARMIERRGGDYTKIPGFDEALSQLQLEDTPYPNLAGYASSAGNGDMAEGLFAILQGGAKQFETAEADAQFRDILDQYHAVQERESASRAEDNRVAEDGAAVQGSVAESGAVNEDFALSGQQKAEPVEFQNTATRQPNLIQDLQRDSLPGQQNIPGFDAPEAKEAAGEIESALGIAPPVEPGRAPVGVERDYTGRMEDYYGLPADSLMVGEPRTEAASDEVAFYESRGLKVVVIDNAPDWYQGGYIPGVEGVVGIRADAKDFKRTLGHEAVHATGVDAIRTIAPELVDEYTQKRKDKASPDYRAKLEADPDLAYREGVAELGGEFATNADFRNRLARKYGELYELLRKAMLKVLGKWNPKEAAKSEIIKALRKEFRRTAANVAKNGAMELSERKATSQESEVRLKLRNGELAGQTYRSIFRPSGSTQAVVEILGQKFTIDDSSRLAKQAGMKLVGGRGKAQLPGKTQRQVNEYFASFPKLSAEDFAFRTKPELSEDRPRQTRTPAFKRWFKGSKVVDENGEPLVVYHGTNAEKDFTAFDSKEASIPGTYFFTPHAEYAGGWAGQKRITPNARVLPTFLSLKNPLVIDYAGRQWDGDSKVVNTAKVGGYDGIIRRNMKSMLHPDITFDEYVAFSPTQIKSATGNKGTFDPTNPNILLSEDKPFDRDKAREGFYKAITEAQSLTELRSRLKSVYGQDVPVDAIRKAVERMRSYVKPELLADMGMTGARKAPTFPTGIKKAAVDAEREQLNLPPLPQSEPQKFEQWNESARATLDRNPDAGRQILNEVSQVDRPLTAREAAVITVHKAQLINRQNDLAAQHIKAVEAGDTQAARELDDAQNIVSDQIQELNAIVRDANSEAGRSLVALKMMVNEDYTLAEMESVYRSANGGERLTPDQKQKIADMHAEIQRLKAELEQVKQQQVDKSINLGRKRVKNREVSDADAAKSRFRQGLESLAKKLKLPFSGASIRLSEDADITGDLRQLADDAIGAGVTNFREFIDALESGVGSKLTEDYRSQLEKVWDAAVVAAEAVDKKFSPDDVRIDEDTTSVELATIAKKLSKYFDEHEGIRERRHNVEAVYNFLKEFKPDITRQETMDAIADYGKVRELNKDPVEVRYRQRRGEIQAVRKLIDMLEGNPPKITGTEKESPGPTKRSIDRLVNNFKRALNIQPTDPAKQASSALSAAKRRIANHIYDLKQAIKAQAPLTRKRSTNFASDPEYAALKADLDQWQARYDEIFTKPELTDAQRIELAIKATERMTAEYGRRIEEGEFLTLRRDLPPSAALDAAKAKREAVKALYQELRALDPQYQAQELLKAARQRERRLTERAERLIDRMQKGDFGPRHTSRMNWVPTQREAQLQAAIDGIVLAFNEEVGKARNIRRWTKDIEDIKQQIQTGVFTTPSPRAEKVLSNEEQRLLVQRNALKQQRDIQIEEQNRSTLRRLWNNSTGLLRTVMTTGELSPVARQGGKALNASIGGLMVGDTWNATAFAKALYRTHRALFSQKYAAEQDSKIFNDPRLGKWSRAGLRITHQGEHIFGSEEIRVSSDIEKLPLIRNFSNAARVFFNTLRTESFEAMSAIYGDAITPEQAQSIANMVNVSTGYAKLGRAEVAAGLANEVLFSARNLAASFQWLALEPYRKADPTTKRLIAKQYAKTFIGLATASALAALAGADIEKDPRSADFLKWRFGNTRIDPLMGLSQIMVFLAREATGEIKGGDKQIRYLRENYRPLNFFRSEAGKASIKASRGTGWDALAQFARSKFSPNLSLIINFVAGKDVTGQPFSFESQGGNLIPMTYMDIYKEMREQGLPRGTAIAILSFYGYGLQTYEPKAKGAAPMTGNWREAAGLSPARKRKSDWRKAAQLK